MERMTADEAATKKVRTGSRKAGQMSSRVFLGTKWWDFVSLN
jgi:hypothetical protein